MVVLAHLEGGEADQHQDQGDDPGTDDDLGLGPPLQLIVVVQRRHAEDALAARVLEVAHLQRHRDGLGDHRRADRATRGTLK